MGDRDVKVGLTPRTPQGLWHGGVDPAPRKVAVMKINVTVDLSKSDRRVIAGWRNLRLGEHGRIASRKQCKDAVLHAVSIFLEVEGSASREDATDEGGD